MDPKLAQVIDLLATALPWVSLIVALTVGGWVFTTWFRIKNGYPLENSWGKPMHPTTDRESIERIKLLTTENAQLRAEVGAMKDRLETVERIVTDRPNLLAEEIDRLSIDKGGRA